MANVDLKLNIENSPFDLLTKRVDRSYGVTCCRGLNADDRDEFTIYRHNVGELMQYIREHDYNNEKTSKVLNCFYSPNVFIRRGGHYRAAKANVCGLRMIWEDIDLKKWVPEITESWRTCKHVKRDFWNILPELLDSAGLPQPTIIDDSGYGFHLEFVFDRLVPVLSKSGKVLKAMYRKTVRGMDSRMNAACKELLGAGLVDMNNADNIAKLFRMPNTYNIKYGRMIKCQTVFYNPRNTYRLGTLYHEFKQCESNAERLAHYQASRAKYKAIGSKWKRQHKERRLKWHERHDNIVMVKNRTMLYMARMKDILTLVRKRNGHMVNTISNRHAYEVTLFCYAINYVHMLGHNWKLDKPGHEADVEKLKTKLTELNTKFDKRQPSWVIQGILNQAKQRGFKGYGYPLNRKQMRLDGAAPYLKTSWYIKKLGITHHEMRAYKLKVLIDKTVKAERRKANYSHKINIKRVRYRRRSKKSGAKAKRQLRINRVINLRKQGKSYREITRIMHCGINTVRRYIKHGKRL